MNTPEKQPRVAVSRIVRRAALAGFAGGFILVFLVALMSATQDWRIAASLDFLSHLTDGSEPLTQAALFTIIGAGLAYLFLNALVNLKGVRGLIKTKDSSTLKKRATTFLLWSLVGVVGVSVAINVVRHVHKIFLSPPLHDIPKFATPLPATPHPATPPPITPLPATPAPPTASRRLYKLVWYNHENGRLWEVLHTQMYKADVRNQEFESWCAPFYESQFKIIQRREVAGDEHFKETPNWWAKAPYNLPALNERWLQIMDDERWYFYELERR